MIDPESDRAARAREHWPLLAGVAAYLPAYAAYYYVLDNAWRPLDAPLLFGLAVVLLGELYRSWRAD